MTKKPLTTKEHEQFAEDIAKAVEILSPHMEILWKAYGVKSKVANRYRSALKKLTSDFCNEMDNKYFEIPEKERQEKKSPWFNSGITKYL